jgi:hypothetical protein
LKAVQQERERQKKLVRVLQPEEAPWKQRTAVPDFLKPLNGHHSIPDIFRALAPAPHRLAAAPQRLSLQDQIAALPPGDPDATRGVLVSMLGMKLEPLWLETLLHQLKEVSGSSLSALKAELRGMEGKLKEAEARERVGRPSKLQERFSYIVGQDRLYDSAARQYISPEAFRRAHNVGPRDAYKEAFEDGGVERFDSTTYWPGKHEREVWLESRRCLNTWRPGELQPAPGDVTPWLKLMTDVARFRPDEVEHFVRYCAFMLQHLDRKINHAVIIGGSPGIGKDTLLLPIKLALGAHNVGDVHSEVLLHPFNDWVVDKKLLVVQEAQLGSRKEARDIENSLKPMCAAPPETLSIHPKGRPVYEAPNVVQLVMTTNSETPLHVSGEDRRYFMMWGERVFSVEEREQEAWSSYWEELHEWLMAGGGAAAVMHHLLTLDVSDFEPGKPAPRTEWHGRAVEGGRSELARLIEEKVETREGCFARDVVTTQQVEAEFLGLGRDAPWGRRNAAQAIGHAATEVGLKRRQIHLSGRKKARVMVVRNFLQWADASEAQLRVEVERKL